MARAGLIPALGKQPLAGKERCRVVSLTPGPRPLETLANVLARIMTNDPSPIKKTREIREELLILNSDKQFDGLLRNANALPDINSAPLIILVDQFEEVYTYQTQKDQSGNAERKAFVENLLYAAKDISKNVSVILTLRSDFLGKTQKNPELNTLFASQGVFVAMMQRDQLAIAITEPAKRAGYEIDKAVVNLLITESGGRDGGLPLLQFALTQIWEGLVAGVAPAETLEQVGGVGGALASKAKSLYDALTPDQQQIARSAFLSMVHLNIDRNNDRKITRRRSTIGEIMRDKHSEKVVREVIEYFARPGVWILVTSSDKKGEREIEMVEIAHETLVNNWKELREWLDLQWESMTKKRKIDEAAIEWKNRNRSKDYLLQGRILRDAREFQKSQKAHSEASLSDDAKEFINASQRNKQKEFLKSAAIFLVFPAIGTLIATHFFLLNLAQTILASEDKECKQNREIPILIQYMILVGQKDNLESIDLCNDNLSKIDLSGATLVDAKFKSAQLAGTKFKDSTLALADFSDANLSNADFSGAMLAEASFQNSTLYNTDFISAKQVKDSQLTKGKLCHTKLPKISTLNPDRDCKVLGL